MAKLKSYFGIWAFCIAGLGCATKSSGLPAAVAATPPPVAAAPAVPAPKPAPEPEPPPPRPADAEGDATYYREKAPLIARESTAELTSIDYVRLRRGRLYVGESRAAETFAEPLSGAFQREEFQVVLDLTGKILADDQTDTRAHMLRSISLRKLNRAKEAEFHRQVALALITSILKSGDGQSPSTAWKVFQVKEEYEVVKVLGGIVDKQALDTLTGESFDILDIQLVQTGETKSVFFNITELFAENGRRLAAK